MRNEMLAIASAVALSIAGSAGAVTTITSGSYTLNDGSFGTGLGVHSNGTQLNTSPLNANVNMDGSAVTFSSTDLLSETGSGEATIVGPFDNLDVTFAKGWDSITFAIDPVKKTSSDMEIFINGSSTAAFSGSGCSICTIAGSGLSKFTVSGPSITELDFTFSQSVTDAKQFRVEGPTAVPEPATWGMMLLGFGVMGATMRRARGKNSAALTGA